MILYYCDFCREKIKEELKSNIEYKKYSITLYPDIIGTKCNKCYKERVIEKIERLFNDKKIRIETGWMGYNNF